MSPEVRALGATVLACLAIVTSGWMVWGALDGPAGAASAGPVVVFAESDDGRLLFEVTDLAVGSRVVSDSEESFRWSALEPASGRLDTAAGRVQLGAGPVSDDRLTEVRVTFGSVAVMDNGSLHELVVPQDVVRLRVPGAPAGPGSHVVLTLDAALSVREVDGLWWFEPFVSSAQWVTEDDDGAVADEGPAASERPSVQRSGSGGAPGSGGGGAGQGSGSGSGSGPSGPDVGRLTIFVRDVPLEAVSRLDVTFGRVALDQPGSVTPQTVFDGARTIDVRAYHTAEARAELVSVQVPARAYDGVRLEFPAAAATIHGEEHKLGVPQPILVLEKGFVVAPGGTTELLVDFSVPESLVLGAEGWEFRPVAMQFQRSLDDTDGDGVHDVADPDDDNDGTPDHEDTDRDGDGEFDAKPAQFRTGGSSLPTLGTGPPPGAADPATSEAESRGSRPVGSEGTVPDPDLDPGPLPEKELPDFRFVQG